MIRRIKKYVTNFIIYFEEFILDVQYTTMIKGYRYCEDSLLSAMVVDAHTIEKGLTMPDKKYNFGHKKIRKIISDIKFYLSKYKQDERIYDIIGILYEYYRWHEIHRIEVSDKNIKEDLEILFKEFPFVEPTSQYTFSKEEFFSKRFSDFLEFSLSRHSCRNLSGLVDEELLSKALELAQSSPSTCNRQATRVHVLYGHEPIVKYQHGNRGFGHIVKKSLLVTSKLSHWEGGRLRHAPYVDGGIYLMNLLYSLHYYGIGACTLNMYQEPREVKKVQKKLSIPKDEIPIALIAIGMPPDVFEIAKSTKRPANTIVTYH